MALTFDQEFHSVTEPGSNEVTIWATDESTKIRTKFVVPPNVITDKLGAGHNPVEAAKNLAVVESKRAQVIAACEKGIRREKGPRSSYSHRTFEATGASQSKSGQLCSLLIFSNG